MKTTKAACVIAMLGGIFLDAAAQDQCKPIGWATRSGRSGGAFTVTGGGSASPVTVKTFADLQKAASGSDAKVIYVDGTLGSGWKGTSGDRLEIGSNKTIIGLKAGTSLKAPIHINGSSNVIVRNIVINGPGSNEDQAWDNINIEGSSKNVWIDHCEFWDGQDGNADVVKGADNVTFTWCIFGYKIKSIHNLSNLIGSSDNEPVSEGKLDVTYMFNWWKAATQRKPRCRYGNIHVVNNLLTGDASVQSGTILGMSAGKDCKIRNENNHFIDEQTPVYTGNAAGSSAQEVIGSLFTNCSGNTTGTGTSFTPPYEYKSFMVDASKVKDLVQKNAGATLASPTSCNGVSDIADKAIESMLQGFLQRENTLVLGNLGSEPTELLVYGLAGEIRHRQILSASQTEIDLSSLGLESGLYVAVAKSSGHVLASTSIKLVR